MAVSHHLGPLPRANTEEVWDGFGTGKLWEMARRVIACSREAEEVLGTVSLMLLRAFKCNFAF